MRRRWLTCIAAAVVVMAAAAWAVGWQRTVPLDQCSQLYREYADRKDIKVSFIKDFYLNDSVSVDVTLMQPITDSAWLALEDELNVSKKNNIYYQDSIHHVTDVDWVQKSNITKHPKELPPDYRKCFYRAVSYNNRTISYFDLEDYQELSETIGYTISLLKTK